MILFFYKNLFQKSFNTCWFYRLLQKNIFGLFYHFSEKVLKVRYTKLSPSGHYAKCFWNNQNTVKMHINFKANSDYLLLQFLFFHSLFFFFILQRMHTDNICRESSTPECIPKPTLWATALSPNSILDF